MQNSEFNVKCEKILFFSLQKSKETELKTQFKGCIFSIIIQKVRVSITLSIKLSFCLRIYTKIHLLYVKMLKFFGQTLKNI